MKGKNQRQVTLPVAMIHHIHLENVGGMLRSKAFRTHTDLAKEKMLRVSPVTMKDVPAK